MEPNRHIGFIGLGSMGMGMASTLLSKGFTVDAYDIRTEARAAWEKQGGGWAESPAEAARRASVLIVMVVNSDQVESVLFDENGAVPALPRGATVIVTSTVPSSFNQALSQRLGTTGHLMLDAPVSGGVAAAKTGNLSIMAAGAPEAFSACDPVLRALASNVFRVGEKPGMGSVVKTVNQLLAGAHIALAAEAIAFGAKAGVDTRMLYDVITHCAGNSWMFSNRVPHMLDDDYRPLSAVNIFVKDLGIVLESAREMNFPTPMAGLAHQLFMMAAASGHARLDDSAVVKVYESIGHTRVASPAPGN